MDSEDFVLDVGSEAEILSDQNHVMPEIGLSVVLECPATGNPQPKVEWFRDNAIIGDSARYEIRTTNGRIQTKFLWHHFGTTLRPAP